MAEKPVKIITIYLSSSRPLIGADLTACFGGIAGPDGRRSQRQTRGLELADDHETGKILRDYADGNSCLIFGPDTPTTNPYNPSVTPDVNGHCVNPESLIPSISDFVLRTKLGPNPGTHRHCLSLFLSSPTGSSKLQAH
jgi:hypothetical protein